MRAAARVLLPCELLQSFVHALLSETDVSLQLGFGDRISARTLPLFACL